MPNDSSPLVSIITPTYNHDKFIGTCIDSVLAQTYGNWEQIIIDDESTDGTAAIVKSYADSRIQFIEQRHIGIEHLATTYNRALSASSGELIAILEGDDFWPSYKLGRTVPAFADNILLAYGLVSETSADGKLTTTLPRRVRMRRTLPASVLRNDPVGGSIPFMMRSDGVDLVAASTVVFRRDALNAIGGFQHVPGLPVVDYPTVMRIAIMGKFGYVDEIVGFRRRHSGSATYANVENIVAGAREFAERLVRSHNIPISAPVRKQIEHSWRKSQYAKEFEQGRVRAASRDWTAARGHFGRALSFLDVPVAVAAGVGWLLSLFRMDMEGLLRLTGRPTLSEH